MGEHVAPEAFVREATLWKSKSFSLHRAQLLEFPIIIPWGRLDAAGGPGLRGEAVIPVIQGELIKLDDPLERENREVPSGWPFAL
ncbi:hypothetical protein KM043_007879 [Ampulex compressa]|nr:hypothetical protein KM043_007879 [Ampulex compressa]